MKPGVLVLAAILTGCGPLSPLPDSMKAGSVDALCAFMGYGDSLEACRQGYANATSDMPDCHDSYIAGLGYHHTKFIGNSTRSGPGPCPNAELPEWLRESAK